MVLRGASSAEFGRLTNSSQDFVIQNTTSDKDIIFKGNDGGSTITALTLDISEGGNATFAGTVTANGTVLTGDQDLSGYLTSLGTAIVDGDFSGSSGLMKKDSAGTYSLDTSSYITSYSVTETDVTAHQAA